MDASRLNRRRFFAPEVLQPSGVDCGPAVLKSLCAGVGLEIQYDQLRELCSTDRDGTTVENLQAAAARVGLETEQIVWPVGNFWSPEANALPVVVLLASPRSGRHFVIAWRRVGKWVQLMDPGRGRRWVSTDRLTPQLALHSVHLPAGVWREQ